MHIFGVSLGNSELNLASFPVSIRAHVLHFTLLSWLRTDVQLKQQQCSCGGLLLLAQDVNLSTVKIAF